MPEVTQSQIEEWIMTQATGTFHYTKVMDGQLAPHLYPQLRNIMKRCENKGIAVRDGKKDGWWRPADNTLEEVAWWDSGDIKDDSIILPLTLNNYCIIPRPSLIVIAGKYNSGKSAFCINTVALNIPKWCGNLDFYVSEGAEMIKPKFAKLGLTGAQPFRTYQRTENFADVINPDNLSVIDYLRVDMEQSYAVSAKIFEIFKKISTGKGIAVVAMQKPPGERKLAFGGASTAFEPALYIGMESNGSNTGWVGFEKIKIPRQYGGVDPYKVKIEYRISSGVEFYDVHQKIGE
jgi:hypothetical protein